MTQTYVNVKKGTYRGKYIENVVFPLIKPFSKGPKGGYITVDGTHLFNKDKVHINIEQVGDYDIVGESDYLAQDVTLESSVSKPAGAKVETDEEVMARIGERFEILHEMTKAACEGNIRAMIVTGPPGVGKSFGVEAELERAAIFDRISGRRVKSEVVKGAATAIGLYQMLYKYSDKDNVLVFDDCDVLFYDDLTLNLLKAALDTGKRRKICWNSESAALRRDGIPESFDFKGSIIFITNLKFDNIKSKKLQDHLHALESRCHFLDLTLDTTREKLLRIKQIAMTGELFDGYDFSRTQEDEIIEFLFENHAKLREVSLRTAIKVADLYKSFPLKWKAMAQTTVMKTEK